jgi:hypothetical protein
VFARLEQAGWEYSIGVRMNAVAETFFATLKKEMVYRRSWPTRPELTSEIFEYVEAFYDPRRRHSTLGMFSPVEFEDERAASRAPAKRVNDLLTTLRVANSSDHYYDNNLGFRLKR